ncbi:SET domain-containing protein [Phlyctema vagabunda]|uniref:SET domain-containing protein n=1 Tax=Phlyctema vagabunda TaxID=108571 RepID=A0ABR4PA69_9HELO
MREEPASSMDIHKEFTEWAVAQGVKINGIAAHKFPGKGLGIIAEKRHEAGDTVLTVPLSALRTVRTVPKLISKAIGKITVHGLLAAHLTLDTSPHRSTWRAVLPSKRDFEESVPLMWHKDLQALLPQDAKSLLDNQNSKLTADWISVSTAFSDMGYEDYLYNWLIVNTRTFYFLVGKSKKPPPRDDCLALSPFADYFNHTEEGCEVEFSSTGYRITTSQPIEKGAEIHISYGAHSNDFLLAEYGFILEENKWDQVKLDSYILPRLSSLQKKELEDAGFLGNYILDKGEICYRTEVAIRALCLPPNRWERFVNGSDDGIGEHVKIQQELLHILEAYKRDVLATIRQLASIKVGLECQRDVLHRRWKQILTLLQNAIDRTRS